MKNKIRQLLEAIHAFRTSKCFLKPSEAKAAIEVAQQLAKLEEQNHLTAERTAMLTLKMKYALAINSLKRVRITTHRPCYEIVINVPIAAFETEVGDARAAQAVTDHIFDSILERHRRSALKK